jgi:hypothetical protein
MGIYFPQDKTPNRKNGEGICKDDVSPEICKNLFRQRNGGTELTAIFGIKVDWI